MRDGGIIVLGTQYLFFLFVSLNFFGAGFKDVLGVGSFIIHKVV